MTEVSFAVVLIDLYLLKTDPQGCDSARIDGGVV